MKKNLKPIILLVLIISAFIFFQQEYHKFLTLNYVQSSLENFKQYHAANPLQTLTVFFIIYIFITAVSIPGAAVMTLLAGALFGFWTGTVVVSFASTIGSSLAFLSSRYFLRDWVQSQFNEKYKMVNEGLTKDGAFYLFSLRVIPIFPFFLVNLLMGLTHIKLHTFYLVSQVGMLAGTAVYVQAGLQLSQIQNLKDIVDPSLLLTFTLLGFLPWLFKGIMTYFKNKKVYKNFPRLKKFEYNTVVIGAGAAGLVSSYISAAVKAKVALIESHKMGGDCLNYGCVPSKAIIKSAKVASIIKAASQYGITTTAIKINFSEVMSRIQSVIKQVEPHDSVERYTELGVECISGKAEVLSPFEVKVNDRVLTTKNIIIAAGAEPIVPRIKGIEKVKYLTSENIWDLKEAPQNLVIVGGGAIGCELAQSFQRLGAQVTLVELGNRLLGRSDEEAAQIINNQLTSEGVRVLISTEVIEIIDDQFIQIKKSDQIEKLNYSHILFALGRKARTVNSGLKNLNLELNPNGTLKHNEFMQTKYPNVYVCGDVAGPIQLTHMAAHQAWFASVNALFSPFKKFKTDYRVVPSVIFTDPEVAQVGLTESEATQKKMEFDTTSYHIDDLDRAICESEVKGFVKILTTKNTDKIIGATIVGSHAGELIAELTLAMKWNIGLNKILSTVHSYPTWSEALKMTAGRWKQNNKPETLLKIVKKFHSIRRG